MGKLLGGGAGSRFTATNNVIDSVCKPCADDSYAADASTDCVAQLQCGNQVTELTCGAGVDRLTGATLLVAGTCADCGAGTWAVTGLTDCATYTAAGNQVGGATRAVGRTQTTDQTSIAACAANTYASGDTVDCVAQITCGNDASGTLRVTTGGDSVTAVATCAACAAGSWAVLGTDDCVACTAIANKAAGATLTCSTAANSKLVTAQCATGFYEVTQADGTVADKCVAATACTGTTDGGTTDRAVTTAATAFADNVCTDCAAKFTAVAGAVPGDNGACRAFLMKCGDQVAVGGAAPVMREVTSVATTTAQIGCGACTAGSFASSATGDCTACTLVAGSIAGTPLTCTSASDSRVTGHKCLACAAKTVGAAGAPDECKATCAAGSYRAGSGLCTTCGADANAAATGVTYTCTTGPGDRQMTGACAADFYLVETGAADVCTAVTACSSNQLTGACFPRVEVDAPTATADRTCTPCTAGTFAANGQTNCVTCGADANAAATGVTYTCTTGAGDRQMTGACAANFYLDGSGAADICRAVTACGNQLTGACFARVEVDASTATADRTCTTCAAGSYAAANGDCLAHTTCGDQVDAPTVSPAAGSRLVGASGILAGTCAACTTGTWGVAAGTTDGDCTACTTVANGEGLTCASATTSRVTKCKATYGWTSGGAGHDTCVAACPCGKWAKTWTTGQPLRCTDVTACAGTTDGAG